ncbi:MAG: transpeptidase family protein [Flavobacteriales bacterium]|nr:transpeptidase family protein [Flavobacteriales bacterium]
MCVVAISILGRIFYIQTVERQHWTEVGDSYIRQQRTIKPSRGQIYSANGSLLATSVPKFDIYWDSKSEAINQDSLDHYFLSLAETFSSVIGNYNIAMKEAIRLGRRYYPIEKKISFLQKKELLQHPFLSKGPNRSGFIFEQIDDREKPFGTLAARTIGKIGNGVKYGIEGAFNAELSGLEGKQLQQRLPGNVWKPVTTEYITEPVEGMDLVSTIDVHLQDVATHALKEQLERHQAEWGTVVLMEVETGFVKAISNLIRDEDDYIESLNKAVTESTEPGSTFKLASLMCALDDGLIQLTDSIETGDGIYHFHGVPMKDSNYKRDGSGGHGKVTIEEVFEQSSNIGTALAIRDAYGMNPQAFLNKLHSMSLGNSLGITIENEGSPFIYKEQKQKNWSGISLTQMSIGYEVTQTPLQTLSFYNAVANKGQMLKPQFVSALMSKGKVIKQFEPIELHHKICSDKTLSKVRTMLEGVTQEGGTADYVFETCKYSVAGKTGTAKIAKPGGGGYYSNRYRASFVGYFPAEQPKYSCIVVVNDTKTGVYYGSSIAAPVFRKLADKIYATRFDFPKQEEEVLIAEAKIPPSKDGSWSELETVYSTLNIPFEGSTEQGWASIQTGTNQVNVREKKWNSGLIPNVKGMGLQDALYLLESLGLQVTVKGYGTVKEQSIAPGSALKNHQHITLRLS